jgi:hypothetical protein
MAIRMLEWDSMRDDDILMAPPPIARPFEKTEDYSFGDTWQCFKKVDKNGKIVKPSCLFDCHFPENKEYPRDIDSDGKLIVDGSLASGSLLPVSERYDDLFEGIG